MWKPSKISLFVLTFLMALFGGITLSFVDWTVLEEGTGVLKELQLSLLFLALSFFFMVPYVKKVKEGNKKEKGA